MAILTIFLVLAIGAVVAIAIVPHRERATPSAAERGPALRLPAPDRSGGMSVSEALSRRRSIREFAAKPLEPKLVAQLCWAAQGITDEEQGFRTAPSAGAIYPITVYIVDHEAVREYEPRTHSLNQIVSGDVRRKLQAAAHDQECVGDAPMCMAIAVDIDKTAEKYGNRAERYCHLEAGHVAQNVLLQATALGLGGVPVGAFDDEKVSAILRLPDRLRPVYLLPLGFPVDS